MLSLIAIGGSEARTFQVAGGNGTLILTIRLPKNYEFIPKAPFSIEISSANPEVISFTAPAPGNFNPQAGCTKIPFTAHSGTVLVTIKTKLFYCDKVSKLCRQDTHETLLAFESASKGSPTVFYYWDIIPKMDPQTDRGKLKTR